MEDKNERRVRENVSKRWKLILLSHFSRHTITHLNVATLINETETPQPTEPEKTDEVIYIQGNHTLVSATDIPTSTYVKCPWTCELTNDAGYVVYSALGSFYIPMLVMLFFYWRIYRAAIRTTRAINQGFRTTKGKQSTTTAKPSLLERFSLIGT